jgi:hypothetical protein
MAGGNPAGPVAGGLATEVPAGNQEVRLVIRKYGRNMNAKKFERRYMYLYISPFSNDDLETGMRKALDAINSLLVVWIPPVRRGFFRTDMWWERVPCPYCLRRMEYENRKWQAGEYVWRRNMCLRHWMVHHLSMIAPGEPTDLISNQPISIAADTTEILYSIETVNYKYRIWLNKMRAEMEVDYKGKTYRYSFKNHLKGFPFNSSYMNILIDVYNTLELFRDFLVDYVQKRRLLNNLVINDVFTLPPAANDTVSESPEGSA